MVRGCDGYWEMFEVGDGPLGVLSTERVLSTIGGVSTERVLSIVLGSIPSVGSRCYWIDSQPWRVSYKNDDNCQESVI